jgi:uncharacterized lipoprotein NlpE involved in copper resistance
MKRKVFVFSLTAAIVIFGLGSCLSNKGAPKTSLDWAGVYTGTIPSASGSGINVRMKLNNDNTYELTYEYVDKSDKTITNTGSFTWNDTGDIINLGIADTPSYYKAAENKLIQLDMAGKPITGKLADMYVLNKQ